MKICHPLLLRNGALLKKILLALTASFLVLNRQNTLGPLPDTMAFLPKEAAKRSIILPKTAFFDIVIFSSALYNIDSAVLKSIVSLKGSCILASVDFLVK